MLFGHTIILAALVAAQTAIATNHTSCFNYFLQKDGCVFASADDETRCNATTGKPEIHTPMHPVGRFQKQGCQKHLKIPAPKPASLGKRYTSENTNTSFAIDDGPGACGNYSTNMPGACLWAGSEQVKGDNPLTAGWLNGAKTSNCGKQLYIQRKGRPDKPFFVPVVDACNFYTFNVTVGCFQIAVTNKTFYDLEPTDQELEQGYLGDLVWDFNNLDGNKTTNGPV